MSLSASTQLNGYWPLFCLGAAYLAVTLVIGFMPAFRKARDSLFKLINPLVLIIACEYCRRVSAPQLNSLILAFELVLLAYLGIHLVGNLYIATYLAKRRKIALSVIIIDTLKFVIIALVTVLFLKSVLHWNLAAILTPSAILTAIVGLAMQDTIGNFIAGLLIQIEKPFEINDWIEVEGQEGQVRELNWRYTKIETVDQYYVIVPNTKIASQKVVNYSKPTPDVNEFLDIGVSYNVPPIKVKRAIKSILESNPHIVHDSNSCVYLDQYADSSINYKIKYAIRDFSYHRQIRDEVLSAVWYQFKKQDIEIPYPIRTVIMQNQAPQQDHSELVNLLGGLPFFEGAGRDGIINMVRFGLIREFDPPQVVVENDADGDSMFFVLDGEFEVRRDGQSIVILRKGDFFGEMSLLTGEKRNARVEAIKRGRLLEIDRNAFKILLEGEPAIMRQIETVFNQRALANREAARDKAKCEDIKQSFFARFKNLFGLE